MHAIPFHPSNANIANCVVAFFRSFWVGLARGKGLEPVFLVKKAEKTTAQLTLIIEHYAD
ncbi:MAG: hypothetical protein FWG02_00820 [Holophagaceae bacterium]|nr:hypothetical protein [Holophagaceae bacterium]